MPRGSKKKVVGGPKGETNFRVTPEEFAPTHNRQTSVSEVGGTHTIPMVVSVGLCLMHANGNVSQLPY